ncbi:MAG: hypothetical protein Ta2B_26110 [Termitinemataceae bacterium]|nr:MAG: hypothetical protein Ta2B_26110 [Termitinemataceae bacterium]
MAISCKQMEVDFSQIATYLSDKTITISDIAGLNIPLAESSPRLSIVSNTQFSGDVKWYTQDSNKLEDGQLFAPDTAYIAYINLKPNKSWTLKGLNENFFKVPYAESTSLSNDGVVTAVFPKSVLKYYTINFNITDDDVIVAGGSLDPVEVPEGYPIAALPLAPRRFGKAFRCWNSGENSGGEDFFSTTLVEDDRFKNIYPVWISVPQGWTYDAATGGMSREFGYCGDVQSFTTVVSGLYKIQAWGAGGGKISSDTYASKGGYIEGTTIIAESTELNIYVGQGGIAASKAGTAVAWNGGGKGAPGSTVYGNDGGAGGGGASDVRIGGTAAANRIIVAGGGGGAANRGYGRYGAGGAGGVGMNGGSQTKGGNGSRGFSNGTETSPTGAGAGVGGGNTGCAPTENGGNGQNGDNIGGEGGGGGGGGYYGGSGGLKGAGTGGGGSTWAQTSGNYIFSGLNAVNALASECKIGDGKIKVTYLP